MFRIREATLPVRRQIRALLRFILFILLAPFLRHESYDGGIVAGFSGYARAPFVGVVTHPSPRMNYRRLIFHW